MRAKIFTVLMVFVAGLAMVKSASAQTATNPYVGEEYTYKWNDVTADSYYYVVTTTATSPTDNPVSTGFSITTGALGSASSPLAGVSGASTADLGITWSTSADGQTYYVWLVATSADGCENWRYVKVTPHYNTDNIDFELAALGIFSKGESIANLESASASNGSNDCPAIDLRDGANFESGATGESDGSVYVYFRAKKLNTNNADTWSCEFSATTGDVEYYDGSNWATYAGAVTGIQNAATQLFRVKVPVPVASAASATTVTGTLANAAEESTGASDSDSNNNSQSFTVNRTAAIGSFGGN